MREFEKYHELKLAGAEPLEVYLKAKEVEGMDFITAVRMLREVYGLDVTGAKSEIVKATHGGMSLSEYQGSLLAGLKEALGDDSV